MTTFDAMRIFVPATVSFLIGIGITPFVTLVLYRYKLWKRRAGKTALDGTPASEFNRLHEHKETGTPRFGGVIVWGSTVLTALLLQIPLVFLPEASEPLAFISRSQTWLPLATLILGGLVGALDDWYEVQGRGGLRLSIRLAAVGGIALFCAWWFYSKLGVSTVSLPFSDATLYLGAAFIPFFVLVALSLYASGVIDGIDGLAGGVFAIIFSAYAGIAFFQHQFDIAALAAAIAGGLLAFLWFNIPPARFYLSETGSMGLTVTLTSIAFLTDTLGQGKGVSVLPIVALPLVVTVCSVLIQLTWKKVFHKKLLRIAPLHHHFEAIGWPAYKVTMRYWVVTIVGAIVGLAFALL